VRHPDDRNNVDRIGDPDAPGLRKGELTRAEKREQLLGKGYGRIPGAVEETLDTIYGPAEATTPALLEPARS
jgi:hypothetical protein